MNLRQTITVSNSLKLLTNSALATPPKKNTIEGTGVLASLMVLVLVLVLVLEWLF